MKFIEEVWEMLAALFTILTLSLQRDIEAWRERHEPVIPEQVQVSVEEAPFDPVAWSRWARGK